LVPSFDLGVGQSQFCGQLESILNAEVFLPLEALLQCLKLVICKGRAGFASFLAQSGGRRGLVVVAVVVVVTGIARLAGRTPVVVVVVVAPLPTCHHLVVFSCA